MRSTPVELAAAIAVGASLLAGCGDSGGADDLDAIVGVVRTARDDVLAGRDRHACSLLTRHARQLSLNFKAEFDDGGAIPPDSPRLPQTCEAVVARMRAEAEEWDRDPMAGGDSWLRPARRAKFELVSYDGSKARVLARAGGGAKATFDLVKTDGGWKIDNSDIVIYGH